MCLDAFGLTAASLAHWRACSAFILAARTWLPNITSRDLVLIGQLQRPLHAMPLGFETRNGSERPQVRPMCNLYSITKNQAAIATSGQNNCLWCWIVGGLEQIQAQMAGAGVKQQLSVAYVAIVY